MNEWILLFKGFRKGLKPYIKYQIMMLFLFSLLVMPIFGAATEALLEFKNMPVVSNHLLLQYMFSWNGFIFAGLLFLVLLLGIVLEIGGLTLISIQQIERHPEKMTRHILLTCLKQMPKMLEAGSLLIVLYFVVATPFIGVGPTLSFLEGFELPEFIQTVLYDQLSIQILLSLLSLLLLLFILRGIFVFHFILYHNLKPSQAIRKSALLVTAHKWLIAKEVIILTLLTTFFIFIVSWGWDGLIQMLITLLDPTHTLTKGLMVALLTLQDMGVLIFGMLFIPFEIYHFTHVYLHIDSKDSQQDQFKAFFETIPSPTGISLFDKLLSNRLTLTLVVVFVLFISAIPGGLFFDEWFRAEQDIAVIAHRGGGSLAAENSLEGIAAAISKEADWSEVDIQRDTLGTYVLCHDPLETGTVYPKLEDALKLAKGKIKLNLELKGDTADVKMVNDVLKMVNALNMKDEVVLTSVDYNLIEYIEKIDSRVSTGMIYMIALGDVTHFQADFVIMEAQQLSEDLLRDLHNEGTQVIVWTVNEPDALWSLVREDVDGIITDEIDLLHQTIEERDQESDEDLLYSIF